MIWPFTKTKASYRDATIALVNEAMSIDVHDILLGGKVNNLEAAVVHFWMVERMFHGLTQEKHEKAGTHVFEAFLSWFSEEYSPDELKSLVIPLISRRVDEYSEIFTGGSTAAGRPDIMQTAKRIAENVSGEPDAHISLASSVALRWYKPVQVAGMQFLEQDKLNGFDWK